MSGLLMSHREKRSCMYHSQTVLQTVLLRVVVRGDSVAEWSARRTRNPAVPGSSPALATCWICARSSRVQILGHACK